MKYFSIPELTASATAQREGKIRFTQLIWEGGAKGAPLAKAARSISAACEECRLSALRSVLQHH